MASAKRKIKNKCKYENKFWKKYLSHFFNCAVFFTILPFSKKINIQKKLCS